MLPFSWEMWMSEEVEWKDIFAFLGCLFLCLREGRREIVEGDSGVLQGLFIRWALLPSPVVGQFIGG